MGLTSAATTELTKYDKRVEYIFELRNAWDTTYNLVDAVNATSTFRIATDLTSIFVAGLRFDVRDTANGNSNSNQVFTVVSSSYSSPNTSIVVSETVANEGAIGYIALWTEYDYISGTIDRKPMRPSTLRVDVPNVPGTYSDEATQSNHYQLGSEVRVTVTVADEKEIKFNGIIKKVLPVDYGFAIVAADRLDEINNKMCIIDMVHADSTAYDPDERSAGSPRPLAFVDGTSNGTRLGKVFGLIMVTPGTDEGFAEDSPYYRRSWVPGNETLWNDATCTDVQVGSDLFQVNYESGAVSILEGFSPYTVVSTTASDTITISGSFANRFPSNVEFAVSDCDVGADNGTFTVDSVSESGGNTIIVVDEAVTGGGTTGTVSKNYHIKDLKVFLESNESGATNCDYANVFKESVEWARADGGMGLTENEYNFADIGLDLSSVWNFEGKVVDLWKRVQKDQQANLVYYYNNATLKFTWEIIEQGASTDWNLLHPVSIDQSREDRDIFTRIEATGKVELPSNVLAFDGVKIKSDDTAVVTVRDERANQGVDGTSDWHAWTKTNGGSNEDFVTSVRYLYDGNQGAGLGCRDLPATENASTHSGAANKYDSWYYYIVVDMGKVRQVDRIRIHMPPSANPNQGHFQNEDDDAVFFPGVWVEISTDDSTYNTISPALDKRRERAGTVLDIRRDELLRRTGRYVRFNMGAFKQGISNSGDPSIGAMEIEIFFEEDYRIVKEIDGNASPVTFYLFTNSHVLPIQAVSTGAGGTFSITGNFTGYFVNGVKFAVTDSTNNDQEWTVDSSVWSTPNTVITVDETVGAVADGDLITRYVQRNEKDLWDRYQQGFRGKEFPLGNRYNEYLAHDVALLEYQESLRLFQRVAATLVCDPRLDMWQTVGVTDELNGDITSILVDGGVSFDMKKLTTTVRGSNYRAGNLGT